MGQGFGGEAARALLRAGGRFRIVFQLALVVVLVGGPAPTFFGADWSAPAPDVLVVLDYPLNTPAPRPEPVARAAPLPRAPQAAPRPSAATAAEPSGGRWVHASWYGPGFFGNRTACGQTYTTASWGIAHKTLPCGTSVTLSYAGRTVTAPVIDRGPYIAGREVDLSAAVAQALGFEGVHPVYLVVH